MTLCAALSLPFVDVRDIVNTANQGLYTGSDRVHPSNDGHVYRGVQMAMRIAPFL
jgi:hypothetical protein